MSEKLLEIRSAVAYNGGGKSDSMAAADAAADAEDVGVRELGTMRSHARGGPGRADWTAASLRIDLTPPDQVTLAIGMRVDVRNRFDNTWTPGFEIEALGVENCQVRRSSDGTLLPVWFSSEDIRPTHHV